MGEFLRKLRLLLEMIRFSHTVFALPFACLAVAMAWKLPLPADLETESGSAVSAWLFPVIGVLLCMVGARSAAMAFNRIVDRDIDAGNPRTAGRHLPSGSVSLGVATVFLVVSLLVFFLGTLLFLPNWLPVALAVPVLIVLLGYSYAKRFTALAHYWLGLALMLAPICAWVAIRGQAVLRSPTELLPVVMLGVGVFFWVGGFDIIYACQDEESDRKAGLYSIPAWLGAANALRLAAVSHVLAFFSFLSVIWVAPETMGLGWPLLIALFMIGLLLVYQHWLVSPSDLSRVNTAFFQVNAIISLGLLAVGVMDLWWL